MEECSGHYIVIKFVSFKLILQEPHIEFLLDEKIFFLCHLLSGGGNWCLAQQ
jgi:hypothetical protein